MQSLARIHSVTVFVFDLDFDYSHINGHDLGHCHCYYCHRDLIIIVMAIVLQAGVMMFPKTCMAMVILIFMVMA